ncbi:uncharacterized protein K460DRAFT_360718 [Cucurbitaria berberidis CBS 394.84]|uniref:Uncharacterized protein n=1 Tax=Cucurbitaria berberidis CBS 394.84 TaxID=1168544 RepID=A0A9P4GQI8_9PLEO|nr:uncharacterized protein K460DRAFT_360718 [Cucurbitaria berberidis CBS 394.84]KAF1849870.1 hypothetical protein K460DRAFT_360718 [Cucurbitaria berberidis CBS 394.84]
MQASRAFTRVIAAGSKTSTRQLSMTGPATFSSLLTSDKPIAGAKSSTPRLPASATIPVPEASETGSKVRHFNTSRSLKAVGDSSTIDFAYIPDFDPDLRSAPVEFRVPILPWINPSETVQAEVTEAEEPVMVPTIHTVAADGTHIHAPSAMSDMTDSNTVDFQGMAAQVAKGLTKPIVDGEGMTRQLWTGLVEDILGPKAKRS